jgi:hypothetical protein
MIFTVNLSMIRTCARIKLKTVTVFCLKVLISNTDIIAEEELKMMGQTPVTSVRISQVRFAHHVLEMNHPV